MVAPLPGTINGNTVEVAKLVISLSIPISVIATFALLYFNGFPLNLMTLGGLALGVGMMLDSSHQWRNGGGNQTQPRVSDLMRGKIDLFSLAALVNMASMAGLQIEMRVLKST